MNSIIFPQGREENDPQTGDDLTDILDRIGFNAVCAQSFNGRFKLRHRRKTDA